MLCRICGAEISDDAQKCEFCGSAVNELVDDAGETKVIDTDEVRKVLSEHEEDVAVIRDNQADEEPETEIYDENERKRREQVKRMMEDKKQQLSEIERRRNEKRKKQRRNRIALIAAVCALAVASVGIGVYYLDMNISGGESKATPEPTAAVVATPTVTPTVSPSASPSASPEINMTAEPKKEEATSSDGQTWTATDNGASSAATTGTSNKTTANANTSGGSKKSSTSSNTSSQSTSNKATGGQAVATGTASNAKESGVSTANISSQLSTGGEVIYNDATGKYLMTFVTNDVKYYATVSTGSTTDQVRGKSYTITAKPTIETYNGNTVYDITSMAKYDGDYILPNSGTKLLTNNDIKGMSKHDLALARNEIYARHGRKFQTEEYSKYFSAKSWYSKNPNYNYADDESNLNSIEIKNVQFILSAETK